MDSLLGPIDPPDCFYANTTLSWLLWLCSVVWSTEGLCLLLYSFSSWFLRQFLVLFGSIENLGLFALVLWKTSWVIWKRLHMVSLVAQGFSSAASGKKQKQACQCRRHKRCDPRVWSKGSIPGSGRSSGGGDGNPLQYSCLKNLMERGAWQATVHEVTKSWTRLSNLGLMLH